MPVGGCVDSCGFIPLSQRTWLTTMTAPTTSDKRPALTPLVAVSPVIAFVGLVLWNIVHKTVWVDEMYAFVTSANHSLAETASRAVHFDLQPPLYYLLLNLWLRLSPTVAAGRVLSLICAAAAVALVPVTARRAGIKHPIWALWLVAASPAVIWSGAELRGYAFGLLLVSLANLLFVEIAFGEPKRPRLTAVAYGVTALLCVLTYYYAGLVLLGHAVAALIWKPLRRKAGVPLGLAAVAFLPFLPTARWQAATYHNPLMQYQDGYHIRHHFYHAILSWAVLMSGRSPDVELPMSRMVMFLVFVLPVAVWVLVRLTKTRGSAAMNTGSGGLEPVLVLGIVVLIPAIGWAFIRTSTILLIEPRHMVLAWPISLLWLMLVFDSLPWSRASVVGWGAVLAFSLVSTVVDERDGVDTGPSLTLTWQYAGWDSVAAFLARRAKHDEPVLVNPPYQTLPFDYYYKSASPVVSVPAPLVTDRDDRPAYLIHDTAQLAASFELANKASSFWVVEGPSDTLAEQKLLDDYIANHYSPVVDSQIAKVRVRQMVKR